ncbi:inositol monophosphatase [Russula earlei]|uniref:Inositol monophosphatase n=1 Tax=Russula earlei TaxID=71964 RepID=A0ACC0UGB9_9AGAM|nr:inositol monophosphatase [Russula earlei]
MPSPLKATDLQDILGFTIQLARKAGALMLEGSYAIQRAGAGSIGEKKNAVDLVTEYDIKVEELVRSEIARTYPHFQFIGEESYSSGTRPPLTDMPTFCVDPIDGTTNFVHGFPYACVSLGLIDQRVPVLGVIYNPFLEHLYTGVRGAGSFLHTRTPAAPNGQCGGTDRLPLAPARPLPGLASALIAVEWGSDRAQEPIRCKADSFARLAGAPPRGVMAHSLRSVGSAALNFALVAQGALDMYWCIGCWPWDVCAGIVIAQEAGAFVTGSKDAPHDGIVTEAVLTGRRYLVIRGVAGTPEESSLDVQKRIARDFYDTVEDIPLDE